MVAYVSESYPSRIRGVAISFVSAMENLGVGAGQLLIGFGIERGISTMQIMTVCSIISIIALTCGKETLNEPLG